MSICTAISRDQFRFRLFVRKRRGDALRPAHFQVCSWNNRRRHAPSLCACMRVKPLAAASLSDIMSGGRASERPYTRLSLLSSPRSLRPRTPSRQCPWYELITANGGSNLADSLSRLLRCSRKWIARNYWYERELIVSSFHFPRT
jgi:hypothetical protein